MPENLQTSDTAVTVLSSAVSAIAGFASKMVIDTFRRSDKREEDLLKLADKLANERKEAEVKFHESAMKFADSCNQMNNSVNNLAESIDTLSEKIDQLQGNGSNTNGEHG